MAFEKKRAFCVVVGRNGDRAVIEGLPEAGERMERPLEATSLLAAHKAAFGRLPDLDPGIRDLVVVLNELPGIQTWSSCEGHKHHDDPCASVSMQFENLTAIEHFIDRKKPRAMRASTSVIDPKADACVNVEVVFLAAANMGQSNHV